MKHWTWLVPVLSIALLVAALVAGAGTWLVVLCSAGLIGSVAAAVHHAEVVAHRVGEPFGTLVLAVSVTVIEASLILSMMLAGGPEVASLARDTIYAAIMIICNGVIGACVLVGGIVHREQSFRVEGANAGLAATHRHGRAVAGAPQLHHHDGQRHLQRTAARVRRDHVGRPVGGVRFHPDRSSPRLLPSQRRDERRAARDAAHQPAKRAVSFGLLLVSLVAVVGLAKILSPSIESALVKAGAPSAVLGILIAMIVLMPEGYAAMRAARADRLQTSLNLAIGSALASIGLTIPVVAVAVIVLDIPLVLGLGEKDLVMLVVTFLVSIVTLASGRTHMMQGAVHLVLFAAFVFLAFVP